VYPTYKWQVYSRVRFGHTKDQRGSKSQELLYNIVKTVIPNIPVYSNYRLPLEDRKITKESLPSYEFDVSYSVLYISQKLTSKVFIPHLSLAFEYQGETHYFSSHIFGKASNRQRADQIKRNFAKQMGITLISIPFWWDKSPNSLASTIRHYRPEIDINEVFLSKSAIPSEMPAKFQNSQYFTANCAREFNNQVNPTRWYVCM
jgi:hypothetical protein